MYPRQRYYQNSQSRHKDLSSRTRKYYTRKDSATSALWARQSRAMFPDRRHQSTENRKSRYQWQISSQNTWKDRRKAHNKFIPRKGNRM